MIALTTLSLLILAQTPDLAGKTIDVTAGSAANGDLTLASTNLLFYGELWKLRVANDQVGLREMIESGQAISVKKGTNTLIMEAHDNDFIADHPLLEVRILDGEHKDKKAFLHARDFLPRQDEPTEQKVAQEYRQRFRSAQNFAKDLGRQSRAKYLKERHEEIVVDMCRKYNITTEQLERYVTGKKG